MAKKRLPLPKVERRYFRAADGARIAYYLAGRRGRPPLVISAGLGGGIRAWSGIITRLRKHFHIIAWDYRGLYASVETEPPSSERLTIEAHASDLASLVDHLGLHRDERPILAGWSMGVQVTFELGRERPDLARGIIALHGSPGGILSTAFNSDTFERISPFIFETMKRHGTLLRGPARVLARSRRFALAVMSAAHELGIMDDSADPDIFHDMARDWVTLDLKTYATIFEHLGEHDARDILPTLDMPALVVAGDADQFTPMRLSEEIVSLLPDAELFVVPEATHFGPLEFPGIIADEILRFTHARILDADER